MSDKPWVIRIKGAGDIQHAGLTAQQLVRELLQENQAVASAFFQDVKSGKDPLNLLDDIVYPVDDE